MAPGHGSDMSEKLFDKTITNEALDSWSKEENGKSFT